MTEPLLTPYEVERKLLALSDALDRATEDLIEAESNLTSARRNYEMAMARARVSLAKDHTESRLTVQEKADLALLNCEDERVVMDAAEIWAKGSKAQVANLRAQVDIIRSVGTSVRSSIEMT